MGSDGGRPTTSKSSEAASISHDICFRRSEGSKVIFVSEELSAKGHLSGENFSFLLCFQYIYRAEIGASNDCDSLRGMPPADASAGAPSDDTLTQRKYFLIPTSLFIQTKERTHKQASTSTQTFHRSANKPDSIKRVSRPSLRRSNLAAKRVLTVSQLLFAIAKIYETFSTRKDSSQ